jgi:SAM-dependent methyltransferase
MRLSQSFRWALAVACLALVATSSAALAQPAKDFEPQVGQRGKDVIWVPTPQALVDKMLDTAKVTPADYVVDLGSGDGRTVITAAQRGAKALGIEYNPDMVELSKRNAAKAGVGEKAAFVKGDIFESDFSQATVVTMFLLSSLNLKLRPTILDMKPGTRVVSNTFDMGDWQPDEIIDAQTSQDCTSYCRGFFWVVPAKVAGTWKLPQGELAIEQTYQMISGTLKSGNVIAPVKGKLNGTEITFTAGDAHYTGRVSGTAMEGTSRSGGTEGKWQATKM